MANDPFGALGLTADASADDVRGARRRLAKEHHPDRGGDADTMRALNDAAAAALRRLAASTAPRTSAPTDPLGPERREAGRPEGEPDGMTADMPSFTVEALPAEAFEALLIVATWLGDVRDDDPPYRLDVVLADPLGCWCRFDLAPDAGATAVSLTIGSLDDGALPPIEAVRDVVVDALNHLDWDDTGPADPRATC